VDRTLKNVFKIFPDKISEEEKDRKVHEVLERIIVESDSVEQILFPHQHPYTKRLISDVPKLHEKFKFTLT